MTTNSAPIERSRAAVRSWVSAAGAGLRKATPYGILALLAASAVAPVAGAALGTSAEYSAALNQLGGMGSNYLADVLVLSAQRVRGREPSEDEWRDVVAGELLARLEAGDAALGDEVAALLRAVDAVDVALHAADDRSRQELAEAFATLGGLAEDAAAALADIQLRLAEQGREQRLQTDMLRQSLVVAAQLRQEMMVSRPAPELPPPSAPAPAEAVPYPGLASFDVLDAQFFRGRAAVVAELIGRLSEQLVGGPPLVVVGVSGAGKSSLLRAGVLPAVAAGGLGGDSGGWPWLIMTPGAAPLAEFTGGAAALSTDRFVILVDQFEELFTQCPDPAERIAFVESLAAARPALLIIALRADFYAQCTELPPMVPMLGDGQVVLGPLGLDDLRQAIREPATEAGLTVEPGLSELLLSDLGAPGYQPGALPLLAHALRATWERREGTTLTVEGYRRTGGIRRALAETAERIYLDRDQTDQVALRTAMLGLVTVVDDVPVRRRCARSEVDMDRLRPMIAARLVTAGKDTVEISHDALLTGWPRLAGWLVEAREEILLRQRLAQAAADWSAAGADADALYRGGRLEAAQDWAAGQVDVPELQRRFLSASAVAAEERELVRRRATRRLRRLVAGLAAALLLVAAGGVVVWRLRAQSESQRRIALSRQLAAEARNEHFPDPDSSARKSIAAWRYAPTVEARSALMFAQHTAVSRPLGSEPGGAVVAVSPDARLVAVGFADGRIQLWDAATRQRVGPQIRQPGDGTLMSLRFSPDGRFLASGSAALTGVAIWNLPSGTLRRQLPGFGAVAWLPDASAVLAGRTDVKVPGPVGAWDPDTGRVLASIPTRAPGPISLAVSRDGAYLAVVGTNNAELVRRADGHQVAALGSGLLSVGFAADGTLFGSGNETGVRVWRPGAGWRPVHLNNLETGETSGHLAVTQDGTAFIGGDEPREILALTAGGPRQPVIGYPTAPLDLALSADDRLLAITNTLAPAYLIRLGTDELPHPQVVYHLAFDPSGQQLATASTDPVIRIWDPRTSTLRDTITVPGDAGPLGLAYAPDGSLAASLGDGRILVFDPGHRLRGTLKLKPEFYPGGVAFSPDGSLLAVVTNHRSDLDRGLSPLEVEARPDPDVQVWDTRTLALRAQIRVPRQVSIDEAFTPDGRFLLVATNRSRGDGGNQDGALWRYRLPDLSPVDQHDLPGSAVSAIAVSPDSASVALAHGNSATILRTDGLTPDGTIATHPVPLSRVAWSPDGRTVATATDDDSDVVRLWDTTTRGLIAEVRTNSNQYGQIAFSPDSSVLAAGAGDWTVSLWHLDPQEAVRGLCATTPGRPCAP